MDVALTGDPVASSLERIISFLVQAGFLLFAGICVVSAHRIVRGLLSAPGAPRALIRARERTVYALLAGLALSLSLAIHVALAASRISVPVGFDVSDRAVLGMVELAVGEQSWRARPGLLVPIAAGDRLELRIEPLARSVADLQRGLEGQARFARMLLLARSRQPIAADPRLHGEDGL